MSKKLNSAHSNFGKHNDDALLPLPPALWDAHRTVMERAQSQWVEGKRIPPVLLLTGPQGSGKRSIAHALAQWFFCEKGPSTITGQIEAAEASLGLFGDEPVPPAQSSKIESVACGSCPSCQRSLKGQWLEFYELRPEVSEDGKTGSLKIDRFRELKDRVGFAASGAGYRVVLIDPAEALTPQAANSLLKLLEEPPKGWIFILTAQDPSLLLPTLVSRCQRLRLQPLPTHTLQTLLEDDGVAAGIARQAAERAQGSWERARLLSQEEIREHWALIEKLPHQPSASVPALIQWAANDPRHLALLIDGLEIEIKRILLTPEPRAKNSSFLWRESERLMRTKRILGAPLQRKLLAQELLLPWLSATTAQQ